eukprot:Platyproteum_vivax@DN16141_c0_g1_i1.p2
MLSDLQKYPDCSFYLVTSGHVIPTLIKLSLMGLKEFFPSDKIYSACQVGKLHCFNAIMDLLKQQQATLVATNSEIGRLTILTVGDGEEERLATEECGFSQFIHVKKLHDLNKAHNEVLLWVEEANS